MVGREGRGNRGKGREGSGGFTRAGERHAPLADGLAIEVLVYLTSVTVYELVNLLFIICSHRKWPHLAITSIL